MRTAQLMWMMAVAWAGAGTLRAQEIPAESPLANSSQSLTGTKAGDTTKITLPGEVNLNLVWCPPGTFTMGSPATEKDRREDEDDTELAGGKPVPVTLTKGYWLGQTEITQSQWTAVMGTTSKPWSRSRYVKEGPNFPASSISQGMNPDGTIEPDSATAFCEKLTEIERKAGRLPMGWKYTLPTEAQWEYACRAGTKTAYSFGDDVSKLGAYAWYDENASDIGEKYAHAVGTKQPNPWGLSDMHGNLYERCHDEYEFMLLGGRDPMNTSTLDIRVLRGGAWSQPAGYARSARRSGNSPDIRNPIMGFRVSRTQ